MPQKSDPGLATLRKHINGQVREFKKNRKSFNRLLNILVTILNNAAKTLPGYPIVHGRVKELDSFVEKCIRKRHKYDKPAWQLTDLCGVRIIVLSQDAIPAVCRFIEENFLISEQENTSGRLKEMEFGYQSIHYIVSLKVDKKDAYALVRGGIPEDLFNIRSVEEAKQEGLKAGPVFKAEIQVRTLLQHAWSAAVHDNLYKTEMKYKPRHLVRESALIAALVEEADTSIVNLIQGTDEYQSYYGAYMTDEEIRQEILLQRIIFFHDPLTPKAALKIARLVDCLGDPDEFPGVEAILSPFEDQKNAQVLRELGIVRLKLGKQNQGKKNLIDAAALDPDNPDTWCELGKAFLEEDNDGGQALKYFQKAYNKAPEYPRALKHYIECRIFTSGDNAADMIPLIRHNIEKAIEKSLQRIEAGVHLPHAWYDIGFFKLVLGRPYESLSAFAKAIRATTSPALVQSAYDSLTRMQKRLVDKNSDITRGMTWARAFLKIILISRYHALPLENLSAGEPELDGFSSLAPSFRGKKANSFQPEDPIIIVAGSCSADSQKIMLEYEPLIKDAFAGFTGTLCGGGTDAGISGIIGRLDNNNGQIRKLAYLPRGIKSMAEYETIETLSGAFSPLDPIMLWADLLHCGINPAQVRVLGIRGGDISAFEYQLALLLGARVGVLTESGGVARQIALDPDWSNEKTILLRLPNDLESLRAFINPSRPSGLIDPASREKMAADIHEFYSKDARKTHDKTWEELTETFKKANLGMIDHIEDKLKRIGLSLRKTRKKKPDIYTFSLEELGTLAEMEHGRWVVERLEDGWTLGERNDKEKTRPQLIPWAGLSYDDKKKNYDAIQKFPGILAKSGYEIFRIGC